MANGKIERDIPVFIEDLEILTLINQCFLNQN